MNLNEVRYQDPATETYLGSPSLVRLPDGAMLTIHDYFGPKAPRRLTEDGAYHLTSVYRSDDDGKTWRNLTHVSGAFWSSLHVLGGTVYMLGVSHQYGHIVIRRSTDGGFTWTHPQDETSGEPESAASGLLFRAEPRPAGPNYHCAPVPIAVHDGRIYRAFEDNTPLDWPRGFQACVISAPVDANLLDAANWRKSEKLPFDPAWVSNDFDRAGWLEGNVVVGPDGDLWNVLRVNARSAEGTGELWNTAAMVKVTGEGRTLTFDPATGFIELPGGHSKFTIRRDPATDLYLTLANGVGDTARPSRRSVLGLYASEDLRHWEEVTTLLEDDSDLTWAQSAAQTGFQYVDWHIDGGDLIYLVRTAYDGAHTFHDANRITFHHFRAYAEWLR